MHMITVYYLSWIQSLSHQYIDWAIEVLGSKDEYYSYNYFSTLIDLLENEIGFNTSPNIYLLEIYPKMFDYLF